MWRWTALVVALAVCENSAPLGALAAEAPHSAVDQCDPQSLRVGIRFDGVPMLSMNKTETPVECCQLCAAEIRCKGWLCPPCPRFPLLWWTPTCVSQLCCKRHDCCFYSMLSMVVIRRLCRKLGAVAAHPVDRALL